MRAASSSGRLVVLTIVAATMAGSVGDALAATAPFTLQRPTCNRPTTIVGRGCVDRSQMTDASLWDLAGGSARWVSEPFTNVYRWTVPRVIPGAGGSITLTLNATAATGIRSCPAVSVSGGFATKRLLACAESGQTVGTSLTVKLVPPVPAAGHVASLSVAVEDGPVYTYTYRRGRTR
jgi:hypothetical protein